MDGILEELLTIEHENDMFFEGLKFSLIAESYTCLRETGTEMILEGVDFKKIKESVVKWVINLKEKLKTLWEKIKGIFAQRLKRQQRVQKRLGADKVHLKGGYNKKVLDIDFIEKTFTDAHQNITNIVDDYANKLKESIVYDLNSPDIIHDIEKEAERVEDLKNLYTPVEQDAIYYVAPAEECVNNYKSIVDSITNQYNSLQDHCQKSIDTMTTAVDLYTKNRDLADKAQHTSTNSKVRLAGAKAALNYKKARMTFKSLIDIVKKQLTALTSIFNTSISCANKSYSFAQAILNARPQEG